MPVILSIGSLPFFFTINSFETTKLHILSITYTLYIHIDFSLKNHQYYIHVGNIELLLF